MRIDDLYREAVETGVIHEVEPHTTTLMYKMGKNIFFQGLSDKHQDYTKRGFGFV